MAALPVAACKLGCFQSITRNHRVVSIRKSRLQFFVAATRRGVVVLALLETSKKVNRVVNIFRTGVLLNVASQQIVSIGSIVPVTLVGYAPVAPRSLGIVWERCSAGLIKRQVDAQIVLCTSLVSYINQRIQNAREKQDESAPTAVRTALRLHAGQHGGHSG